MKYTKFAVASVVAFGSVDSSRGSLRGQNTAARRGLIHEEKVPPVKEAKELKALKEVPPPNGPPPGLKGADPDTDVVGESRTVGDLDYSVLQQIMNSEKYYAEEYGYACRYNSDGLGGPGSYENSDENEYFEVEEAETLEDCQQACTDRKDCVGVEYRHIGGNRCELWKAEIGHVKVSASFGCYRKLVGAPDAVCRVDRSLIKGGPYDAATADGEYYTTTSAADLAECQTQCANDLDCTGVGYNACQQECQVWKVQIGAIIPVEGNSCFRKHKTAYVPNFNTTATTP